MTNRVLPAAFLAVFLCIGMAAADEAVVTGRVFLDGNANGARDQGEEGLAGVGVTDGVAYEVSGADGSFTLALGADPVLSQGGVPIVSMSTPSGYRATTPWFARIERPPAFVEFGLAARVQTLPFVFVHGTDPHVPRGGEHMFLDFRRDLAELRSALEFCILTGDLVHLGDNQPEAEVVRQFDLLEAGLAGFPLPFFCVPGNHDIVGVRAPNLWDKRNPLHGYGAYTRRVGPFRWSFGYAGIHFAGVDFNQLADGQWKWGVPQSAVDWLEKDLARVPAGARIFVFLHFPIGVEALQKVLEKYNVAQIFHGHDHVDAARKFGSVPCVSSASLSQIFGDRDRSPGYRLVRVTESGIDTFFRTTRAPHALTLDVPRHNSVLATEVRGAIFDPAGALGALTVTVGEEQHAATLQRGPFWSRFAVTLKAAPPLGSHVPVTVQWGEAGKKAWSRLYFRTEPEKPAAPSAAPAGAAPATTTKTSASSASSGCARATTASS